QSTLTDRAPLTLAQRMAPFWLYSVREAFEPFGMAPHNVKRPSLQNPRLEILMRFPVAALICSQNPRERGVGEGRKPITLGMISVLKHLRQETQPACAGRAEASVS